MSKDPEWELRWPLHKRFWVWLLRCGAFSKPLFFIAAFIVYYVFVHELPPSFGFGDVGLAVGVMVVFVVIGRRISVHETRSVQRARDRKAAEILEAALNKKLSRYYLYLRPFFLTGYLDLTNPEHQGLPFAVSHYSEAKTTDLETLLERAVRKSGPLVALGQPGEMIGAGRLAVPEEVWKARFVALARRASCIFVIPSHTTGTTWEIRWLQDNGHLAKCAFIMPPFVRIAGIDMKFLWELAASVLAESNLHLPAYSAPGLVFTLNDAGTVRTRAEIGNAARLRTKLAKIGAML
jgi:hypothetical protein